MISVKNIIGMLALASSFSALSAWKVDVEQSDIHFLSTKKEHVIEIHKFDRFEGVLSEQGQLAIQIDLTSVNTLIPIRDERLQKFLFDTVKFAQAEFSLTIDLTLFNPLAAGESMTQSFTGEFSLHGIKRPLKVKASVTKTASGGYLVQSVKPALIDTRKYNMQAGVDKLVELASLSSIAYSVPVTFALTFEEYTTAEVLGSAINQ